MNRRTPPTTNAKDKIEALIHELLPCRLVVTDMSAKHLILIYAVYVYICAIYILSIYMSLFKSSCATNVWFQLVVTAVCLRMVKSSFERKLLKLPFTLETSGSFLETSGF